MKRKIADILMDETKPPSSPSEPREQLHKVIQTKADKQFTLDNMFSANATNREKERAKARKLFRQASVATTNKSQLSPSLHEDHSHEVPLDKHSAAVLTDAEMRILGMEKTALGGIDDIIGAGIGHHAGRKQRERREAYDFAGPQLAAALLLPGGAGYQAGRYVAHHSRAKPKRKHASVAPHVDAWFEKNSSAFLTQAQQRYPELLKAAADTRPVPNLKRGPNTASPTRGAVAARSSLSGGAA